MIFYIGTVDLNKKIKILILFILLSIYLMIIFKTFSIIFGDRLLTHYNLMGTLLDVSDLVSN